MIRPPFSLVARIAGSLQRIPAAILMLTAFGTGAAARILLDGWPAAAGYLLAALLFMQAVAVRRSRPELARLSPRAGLVTAALAATATISLVVRQNFGDAFPLWGLVLLVWVASLVAYVGAWAPRSLAGKLGQRLATRRRELLLLAGIVAVGLLARTWSLNDLPRAFGGDDGQTAIIAREVLHGRPLPPFSTIPVALGNHPTLYFLAQSAAMRLGGDDVAGSRLFSALVGVAGVAVVYALGRQWFGPTVGLVAAALLTTFPLHLFWSRNPQNNVGDSLAFLVALLFTTRAFAGGRPLNFALAGLSIGLGQYAYQSARLLFILVPCLIVRELLADRRWLTRHWRHLLILAGGVAVAYLPQVAYYVDHVDAYIGRINQVSIFQPGWLATEARQSGQSALGVIGGQLVRTFLVFYSVPAATFFETGRPLFDPVSGIIFTFGVSTTLLAIRQRGSFALLTTLVGIVGTSALTISTPNSARLIGAAPFAVLFVAVGLREAVETIASRPPWLGRTLLGLVSGGIVIAAGYFFFFEYANRSNYDYPNGEVSTELAYIMRQYPPATRFIFLALPRMSCTTQASLKFIAPEQQCVDMPATRDRTRPPRPELGPSDILVALPERRTEAERLVTGRPDLQPRDIPRINGTSTLFTIWLPAEQPDSPR